jgi:hypothetical protein
MLISFVALALAVLCSLLGAVWLVLRRADQARRMRCLGALQRQADAWRADRVSAWGEVRKDS